MKKLKLTLLLCLFYYVLFAQENSKFIVVDQFGYRPVSEKIAVIRNPMEGFDAAESFAPGNTYAIVSADDQTQVFTSTIVAWNNGNTDTSSGDQIWWFDFSSVEIPGTYYVLDVDNNLKSHEFIIDENVYAEVLKHAFRSFYYQRAGFEKAAEFAGQNWSDDASHLGALQDNQARRFDAKNDANTQRDLSGGWYDAGDYNKYTSWTANYIYDLIKAYEENPDAWTDDYCLPYSDNGTPDIIDEIIWGLDYLLRLQNSDGSMISIVSLDSGSPPSTASGPSLYGAINTSGTLAASGALALAAEFFAQRGQTTYSNTLEQSALAAWDWANDNPDVIWENNSAAYNSVGIGAGQQETNDYGRFMYKMRAAVHLYVLTNDANYKTFVEDNYEDVHLLQWNFAFPFEQHNQETLLFFSSLSSVTSTVTDDINNTYRSAMESGENFMALNTENDPYMAHLKDYVWGSNSTKCRKALMYLNYATFGIDESKNGDALRAAERYIHYLHGVNPLNLCYLSNMKDYGAENGVNEFFHSWFSDGTDWDRAGSDLFGPAPGFLVGGPNPTYDWDACCPSNCPGSTCDPTQRARIINQPDQKSYDDFNTSWPMNSWSVTENSNGYQVSYLRLLSTFVNTSALPPTTCIENTPVTNISRLLNEKSIQAYPNPTVRFIKIESDNIDYVQIFDKKGNSLGKREVPSNRQLDLANFAAGTYVLLMIKDDRIVGATKVVKTNTAY